MDEIAFHSTIHQFSELFVQPRLYSSGDQTFWLVGHICLSETLRGP